MNHKNSPLVWKIVAIILILLICIAVISALSAHRSALAPQPLPVPTATSTSLAGEPVVKQSPRAIPVVIDSIVPVSGNTGSSVTLTGSGFTATDTILFDGYIADLNVPVSASASGQEALVFTVPSGLRPDCKPGQACPQLIRLVTRGAYGVTVENANGTSSYITYAVLNNAF